MWWVVAALIAAPPAPPAPAAAPSSPPVAAIPPPNSPSPTPLSSSIEALWRAAPPAALGLTIHEAAAVLARADVLDGKNGYLRATLPGDRPGPLVVRSAVFTSATTTLLAVTVQRGCRRQTLHLLDARRGFVDVTADVFPAVLISDFWTGGERRPALVDVMLPRFGTTVVVRQGAFCVDTDRMGPPFAVVSELDRASSLDADATHVRLAFDGTAFVRRRGPGVGVAPCPDDPEDRGLTVAGTDGVALVACREPAQTDRTTVYRVDAGASCVAAAGQQVVVDGGALVVDGARVVPETPCPTNR